MRKHWLSHFLLFMFSAAILSSRIGAQSNAASSVHGFLYVWGTSEPVGQAVVELRDASRPGLSPEITVTGANGEFLFSKIPNGSYRVVAFADGFASAEYGQLRPSGIGRLLEIANGESADIVVGLARGGIISGRVSDVDGHALFYSSVEISKISYGINGQIAPTLALSATTNDLGEYRAFWLPPGQYIVHAGPPQLNSYTYQGTINPQGVNSTQPILLISTSNRPRANNAPESDLPQISKNVPILSTYYGNSPDIDGAEIVNLSSGSEVSGVNIRVAPTILSSRTQLRGVVLDPSGQPVQGGFNISILTWPDLRPTVFASIASVTSRVPSTNPADVIRGLQRYVADGGKFEGWASTGVYELRATQGDLSGRSVVDVSSNQDLFVNVSLRTAANIAGRVSVGGVNADLNVDLSKLQVILRSLSVELSSQVMQDGLFQVDRVPLGDYFAFVQPIIPAGTVPRGDPQVTAANSQIRDAEHSVPPIDFEDAYVRAIHIGNKDVSDSGFSSDQYDPSEKLEVIVGLHGGRVIGRVVNTRHEPVNRATVVLLPEDGEKASVKLDQSRSYLTNKSGQFEFRALPPGNYRLFAWEDVDTGAWSNRTFLRQFESQAIPIRVAEGETRNNVEVPVIPVNP